MEKRSGSAMKQEKPTVVVVDDNATIAHIFDLATRELGLELHCFDSAAEAAPYLEEHSPDLLFLDIIMPDKDGLTFLQELRRHPHHGQTPVIMITSKDYEQDRTAARELGALDFVIKPLTSREIQAIIARYLGLRVNGNGPS
ncbi:MAG: response regulator [Gammaproteobacteria bacterium]|nr:MAG: response regulator [Gammaproteobacteria bacterium]